MTFGNGNRARARFLAKRPRATLPLKQSILWGLLLLVGLFIAGIWMISRLDLEYSRRTLAAMQQRQIEMAFANSLDRINRHLRQMEQDAQWLSLIHI